MSKSKAKGTAAEREVVNYARNWWPDAERRALAGAHDKGDMAGVPLVAWEVKAAERQLLAAWQRETLEEMANAGAHACVLVVKRKFKPVHRWDAYLPRHLLKFTSKRTGEPLFLPDDLEGSPEWLRMDLALAVAILRKLGY